MAFHHRVLRQDPRRRRLEGPWRQTAATAARKPLKLGYDYVHSLVDHHSRLACSEILPDEKGPTCATFLKRAIAYFAAHGITRIERLMTRQCWAHRYSLRTPCAARSGPTARSK